MRVALAAAGTSGSAGAASLTLKSTLEKLEEDRPVLFISLHRVLVRVANANASNYRSSASTLLTLIENESDDFPHWYKYKLSRPKSKGEEDMTGGPLWGKRVLEHAGSSGEPVEYDSAFAYGHDFYEIPNPPDPIYSFIRGETTVFGFQIDAIGPFLTRHGIKGFDAVDSVAESVEDSATTTVNTKPGPARTLPWWQTAYDISDLAKSAGERLQAAGEKATNSKIARDIASRICAIERAKGRDRVINWDTVRGALTGWEFRVID